METTEHHRLHRSGWLRASVLGANDGIVSTASLVTGVAAAGTDQSHIVLAGVAGLVAGAMSMAAGEYVSVKSQADTEAADLRAEAKELKRNWDGEKKELALIYENRGLGAGLAQQVAEQMMAHDALGAHARDEIGITDALSARPLQAAAASAGAFALGGIIPVLVAILAPLHLILWLVPVFVGVLLCGLGGVAAWAGGASVTRGAIRVFFWGSLAMLLTGIVGSLFDLNL